MSVLKQHCERVFFNCLARELEVAVFREASLVIFCKARSDRIAAVFPKSTLRNANADGSLTAFVFIPINHLDDFFNDF